MSADLPSWGAWIFLTMGWASSRSRCVRSRHWRSSICPATAWVPSRPASGTSRGQHTSHRLRLLFWPEFNYLIIYCCLFVCYCWSKTCARLVELQFQVPDPFCSCQSDLSLFIISLKCTNVPCRSFEKHCTT